MANGNFFNGGSDFASSGDIIFGEEDTFGSDFNFGGTEDIIFGQEDVFFFGDVVAPGAGSSAPPNFDTDFGAGFDGNSSNVNFGQIGSAIAGATAKIAPLFSRGRTPASGGASALRTKTLAAGEGDSSSTGPGLFSIFSGKTGTGGLGNILVIGAIVLAFAIIAR